MSHHKEPNETTLQPYSTASLSIAGQSLNRRTCKKGTSGFFAAIGGAAARFL